MHRVDDVDDGESRKSDDASVTIQSVAESATIDWIGYVPLKTNGTEGVEAGGCGDGEV